MCFSAMSIFWSWQDVADPSTPRASNLIFV